MFNKYVLNKMKKNSFDGYEGITIEIFQGSDRLFPRII